MVEKRYRSLIKSISWRATGTVDTFLISFIVTGKLNFALSISGFEIITKITLYYLHERVWNRIEKGKAPQVKIDYEI